MKMYDLVKKKCMNRAKVSLKIKAGLKIFCTQALPPGIIALSKPDESIGCGFKPESGLRL